MVGVVRQIEKNLDDSPCDINNPNLQVQVPQRDMFPNYIHPINPR